MKKCPNCGFSNSKDAKFCVKCGHHFAAVNVCPNCGRKLKSGTKFCPYCGAKQDVNSNHVSNGNNAKFTSQSQPQFNNIKQNNTYNSADQRMNNEQGSFTGTMNNYNQRMYNYARRTHNSFVGSLAKFFDNYANFSGRSTRSDFWFVVLWRLILWACIGLLCFVFIGFVVGPILYIALFIPRNALRARRLRDAGMSNGCITALLICYYVLFWTGIPFIILIIFALMPSVQYPINNQFYQNSVNNNFQSQNMN